MLHWPLHPKKPFGFSNSWETCLAKNQSIHRCTRHTEIKYHFIHDAVEAGKIKLVYCASEDMIADMLTKVLSIRQFKETQKTGWG